MKTGITTKPLGIFFKRYSILCSILLLLALESCHTLKKSAGNTTSTPADSKNTFTPDFILSRLRESTIDYKTFSAKAKLSYTTPRESQKGITTYIRMQKDSAIWISVRPVLGIELIRVLITPDSVKMINFFKKTLTIRSTDSLQQLLHIPYDFSMLQNLIVGNPLLITTPEDIRKQGDTLSFFCTNDQFISSFKINPEQFLMQSNQLTIRQETGQPRYSNQVFEDYGIINGHSFSSERALDINAPESTYVELLFSRVTLDEPVSLPFPEPSEFKVN